MIFIIVLVENMKIIKHVFFLLICLPRGNLFYLAGDGVGAGDHCRNTLYIFSIIPLWFYKILFIFSQ